MSTPQQQDEGSAERVATDADMRPGLRVRTTEGWVGEVVMKEDCEISPYRVTEGWGKRWVMGYASHFTILPGQDRNETKNQ